MLVVSNGDDQLLDLGANRRGLHFPQMEDGTYAGHHPGDSSEAIAYIEALRQRGATFILFPETALWWLDFYTLIGGQSPMAQRIEGDGCVIFGLEQVRAPSRSCLR